MSARFDLAVVGAGPAGAAAALSAARAGLAVALFEPQAAPDKPCGEGLMPSGVRALAELGLADVVARARKVERIAYVLASGRELQVDLPEPARSLERPVLARALAEAVAAERGVTCIPSRVSCTADEEGFRLAGAGETWRAATLVAADGIQGGAAAWLRRDRGGRARFGLRARAEGRERLRRVEVHLGRHSEVYLTPLPEDRINVAVLRASPRGHVPVAALLAQALDEHPRVRRYLGPWITPPEGRALHRARPWRVAERGAFLAGDAAGGVDPVLGCGVAIALTTGLAAGRAAARVVAEGSGTPEREYARFVAAETGLRRVIAGALTFLSGHPRFQELTALLLGAWPAGARRIAQGVART